MNSKGLKRLATSGAVMLGLAAGSYGVASAATGSGSSTSSTNSASTSARSAAAPSASQPWGGQRSDETLLTGDTAAKVRQAALSAVPGATIIRVETDADGHALYEAHLTKSDGTLATVYVDKDFNVVSTETGPPGPRSTGQSG